MPHRASTSPLAHHRDGNVYLVLDCAADHQTVVADLPSRVVASDTFAGCTHDVSAETARKVRRP
jgi:hypothetical protein